MKNAIIENLNSMDGFKSGWETTEERVNELKDMSEDTFWNIAQRDKETKIWKNLRYISKIYRAIKRNIRLSKILEGRERETGTKQYLKYQELSILQQIHAAQWILCRSKKIRGICIKMHAEHHGEPLIHARVLTAEEWLIGGFWENKVELKSWKGRIAGNLEEQ